MRLYSIWLPKSIHWAHRDREERGSTQIQQEKPMTKIALSLLALAALSTASFADRNRDDTGTYRSGVSVETAAFAVSGSNRAYMNHESGR